MRYVELNSLKLKAFSQVSEWLDFTTMPLYEYRCSDCGARFEALVMGSSKPECPECRSKKLEKQFSTFNAGSGGSASSFADSCQAGGGGGCCGGMCSGHN